MSEQQLRKWSTPDPVYDRILGSVGEILQEMDYNFDEDKFYEILVDMWNRRELMPDDIQELSEDYEKDYWNQICDEKLETKLSEWESLKDRYYNALAYTVYSAKASEVVQHIKKQLTEFKTYLECLDVGVFWFTEEQMLDYMDEDITDISLSSDYPHGWQPHSDEREDGNLYLYRCLHRQIEGMNAVSLRIHEGLWATLTIDVPRPTE